MGPGPTGPLPVVLDTDIGTNVDDAVALCLAARHPALRLVGVTTVSGDPVRRARLAARLAELAGAGDVPVVAGAADREGRARPGFIDGGLRVAPGPAAPGPPGPGAPNRAAAFLSGVPTGTAVIALGPLTNLDDALAARPDLPGRLQRLAVMGGVVRPGPWGPGPADDTNLITEPTAAQRVLGSRAPLLLVPLEVTVRVGWTETHVRRLAGSGDLCGAVLARMVADHAPHLAARSGRRLRPWWPRPPAALLHDALVVAALAEPGLVSAEDVTLFLRRRGRLVVLAEAGPGEGPPIPARLVTGAVPGAAGRILELLLGR